VLEDESVLPQAQWLRAQRVSRPVPPQQAPELELWVLLEPREQAQRARPLALPPLVAEPPVPPVWRLRAVRLQLAEPRALLLAASARPWRPLPSLLFLFWRLLRPALLLQPRPESFCAPSPLHPLESSSSASSFP
jgi:hypothetical protein